MSKKTIVWFRQDLRVADNPALNEAAERGDVLPILIVDETDQDMALRGTARAVWLHHSLLALDKKLGGHLQVFAGDPEQILLAVAAENGADAVFWNRCYTPHRIIADKQIKQFLSERDLAARSFNGSLLWEPWQVLKKDKTPYKVFTPFYKKGCLSAQAPRATVAAPSDISFVGEASDQSMIDGLELLPRHDWAAKMMADWQPGEQGAREAWAQFADNGLMGYKNGRNFPAKANVSRLSPHLAFGEISPHQIWAALEHQPQNEDVAHFRSELAWREFSAYLLYHFPTLPFENFNSKFDQMPWQIDQTALEKWQRGQTGIPIVDAGMRELWQTGYMHNRVRMIVASFLTKNLGVDWREGAKWFEHCLVDADYANNRASWQWVAGSGADAAPYFRVFNPVLQAEKFDPLGAYIRTFVPEIAELPNKFLGKPFEAPAQVLADAGLELGIAYPHPIVDLKQSRNRALAAYQTMRGQDMVEPA
ncbi:cryptochrome/photolyase family protein [Maritalea porphyrae]|uniref:Deoxyribodipyrimidine photo-lyase n=1 Tax=Maritalea porphyrae TaxID=880732 RepID=A0ABQ5UQH1_9HYPH|nr:deoxyribodipyrimidine photo-lyase [Maritalea porphyrae]GLQ16694.1 deoxyribodipyrimidine photo-lyase [Maritalea porphyrae]